MLIKDKIKYITKKTLYYIIEYILVFIFIYMIMRFFNRDVVIKALHLDDLHNLLTYLEFPDIKEWLFHYSEGRLHYRPIFQILLFKYLDIIGTNIPLTLNINFLLSAFIGTNIYFLTKLLKINKALSICIIILYSYINFSYYQIYQLIGFIEGFPMLISLTILVLSIKNLRSDKKYFILYSSLNAVLYFIMVFIHERYFPILLIAFISVLLNNNVSNKKKIIFYIIYFIELLFFFIIRFYFLGIIVPRGTDCTDLVENFNLLRTFKFLFHQIMYLLGINLGPEYLCAIDFINTKTDMKVVIIISALLLLSVIVLYVYRKIKYKNVLSDINDNKVDLLFILYIFLCILQSSLTIRVELRFLYASFMGLIIYMSYMVMYMFKNVYNKFNYIMIIAFSLFFSTRIFTSLYMKEQSEKLFIINEQKVINALYEATIEKYGVEEIKKKTIYISSNNYKTLIDEELYHFFDQFDRKLNNRQIIYITEDVDILTKALYDDNAIILNEGLPYEYMEHKK